MNLRVPCCRHTQINNALRCINEWLRVKVNEFLLLLSRSGACLLVCPASAFLQARRSQGQRDGTLRGRKSARSVYRVALSFCFHVSSRGLRIYCSPYLFGELVGFIPETGHFLRFTSALHSACFENVS